MWLQDLLSTDNAPSQRVSSNRISAADNDYTEGQVMLTGAKLRELIGPHSMAKRPSQQCPGSAPAPPRPRRAWRLWAALGGSAPPAPPEGGTAHRLGPATPPPWLLLWAASDAADVPAVEPPGGVVRAVAQLEVSLDPRPTP